MDVVIHEWYNYLFLKSYFFLVNTFSSFYVKSKHVTIGIGYVFPYRIYTTIQMFGINLK